MIEDLPQPVPMRQVQLPSGELVLVTRALVKDSWLLWKDALPDEEHLWDELTDDAVTSITALAKSLHVMHRAMKGYKRCDESPFTVSRWWDPTCKGDADDNYDSGKFALLKFDGLSAFDLSTMIPRSSSLVLNPVSPRAPDWVEAQLQDKPVHEKPLLPLAGLGLTAELTSGALEP